MRILIIGGTRMVGRQIALAAIDRGHDVTLFNRGRAAPQGLAGAAQLTGDRNHDLAALANGEWDTTIDVCAYYPSQVRRLLEALGPRAGRYVFVSTISVYGRDVSDSGFTEQAALLPPEWSDDADGMERYGELKVACEQVAAELAGDGLLVLRPGYVIGPHDYTDRFTQWIRRVAAGEPFDAPPADQPLQAIDSRDLGEFTVGCVEQGLTAAFNVTAPQDPPTFREVLETIAAVLGVPLPPVRWADPDDVGDDLPLAAPREWWPKMRADLSAARAAGLRWRPLAETVRDTAAAIQ